MSRKILIIDNQYHDYKLIFDKISGAGYDVYPKDDYARVLDYVRIYLNPQYGDDRNQRGLDKLINYINEKQIELIILDYKLSGTYNGLTGVELFMEINALNEDINFVFFSRTPRKLDSVRDKLNSLPYPIEWIEKDEAGLKMDEPSYFRKSVLEQLGRLLGKEKLQRDLDKFKKIRSLNIVSQENFVPILDTLMEQAQKRGYFLQEHLLIIDKCSSVKEPYIIIEELAKLKTEES